MDWNPEQYLKFAAPRLRPALDLLAHIALDAPATVHDLGCGTGNVTRLLAQRWPAAAVTGVDDSPEMLAQAQSENPHIRWQRQSMSAWTAPDPADLIFSNAALHWLPDHGSLFPRLLAMLAQGGVLAVQMPANFRAPSHALIAETIAAGSWSARLSPLLGPPPVHEPADYYGWLAAAGAADLDVWETSYLHVLDGADAVKEWTKGTWLRQFLAALEPSDRPAFEADYAARLRAAYPRRPDGKTLLPFKRLFIVARKA